MITRKDKEVGRNAPVRKRDLEKQEAHFSGVLVALAGYFRQKRTSRGQELSKMCLFSVKTR